MLKLNLILANYPEILVILIMQYIELYHYLLHFYKVLSLLNKFLKKW